MTLELHQRTIAQLGSGLHSREFSCRELVQAHLDRISALDDRIQAFITIAADEALAAADRVDRDIAAGKELPALAGIPIAVKDSIPTKGIRTTANSRLLEHWVPTTEAAAVRRLREAGAIILGKTNLNEFGWSLPATTDLVPPTRNPWNPELAAIGSSTGSGAAVAAGFCPAALGTDGGGSVRLPAGQNGLVGIKPTHGRVSRLGMDASSMSEISPMARTVADAALMLTAMAGYEVDDPLSWPFAPPAFHEHLEGGISGLRIGILRSYIATTDLETEVDEAFQAGLCVLRQLGAELIDVELPGLVDARAANFIVLNSEAYSDHAVSLRAQPDRYGSSALRYHWMGAFLSASDYLNAKRLGRRVRQLVQDHLRQVQALASPTSPVVTSEAARRPGSHRKGANAAFTAPFNLSGHPAISIPAGISATSGLPIGMQLVGGLHDEEILFRIAHAYEQATDWTERRPTLAIAELSAADR